MSHIQVTLSALKVIRGNNYTTNFGHGIAGAPLAGARL